MNDSVCCLAEGREPARRLLTPAAERYPRILGLPLTAQPPSGTKPSRRQSRRSEQLQVSSLLTRVPPYKDPTPPSGTVTPPRTYQLGQPDKSRSTDASYHASRQDQLSNLTPTRCFSLPGSDLARLASSNPATWIRESARARGVGRFAAAMPDPRLSGPSPSAQAVRIAW